VFKLDEEDLGETLKKLYKREDYIFKILVNIEANNLNRDLNKNTLGFVKSLLAREESNFDVLKKKVFHFGTIEDQGRLSVFSKTRFVFLEDFMVKFGD